jgi:4-hydroxy-2-oxoheptanedioate aldolase
MHIQMIEQFRQKISSGPVYGPFMKSCDPAFVESAGYAGFDFAILDMEHGPVSTESMQNNIRAAEVAGLLPIIRVSGISESEISKALDIGALGVEVPQVTTAEAARSVVQAARFYPEGMRGVCRFVRAAGYSSVDRQQYFKMANQALIVVQLEGQEALANIDEIMLVSGIDVLFIGPYDLSQSLGVPGQTTHPRVIEAMEEIVAKAAGCGRIVGTFTDSRETLAKWKNCGVRYLSYSVDVGIFYEACKGIVGMARSL